MLDRVVVAIAAHHGTGSATSPTRTIRPTAAGPELDDLHPAWTGTVWVVSNDLGNDVDVAWAEWRWGLDGDGMKR